MMFTGGVRMNTIKIGEYIRKLRKTKGMTQHDLADRLDISFQAVSKWETGTSLPDSSILLDLAENLETSVDKLLTAGKVEGNNKEFKISAIVDGFNHLIEVKNCFGETSSFYKGLVKGINEEMNIDFEKYLSQPRTLEVLYTEVILQYIVSGYEIDIDEVGSYIKSEKMKKIIIKYIQKYS
jgi:transcriptional regulator with XRE-family HTH domain